MPAVLPAEPADPPEDLTARGPRHDPGPQRTRVGILFFDRMEELDALGPYEVLAWWARRHPEDAVELVSFSRSGEPVECAKGLVVTPQHSAEDVGALDVLIHPGGFGTRAQLEDPEHLEWLRRQRREVPLLASVCTGALVLAKAGLLAGRPATTYWAALDELAALDRSIEVHRDVRYVDAGDVLTSAGVSAGIDMALHLVARTASPDRARQVARGIEYDYGEHGVRAPGPAATTAVTG